MRHSLHTRLLGVVAAIAMAAFASQGFGVSPAGATSPGSNGRIAFVRLSQATGVNIYSIRSDGTDIKKLVSDADDPAWSSDGRHLVFGKVGTQRSWSIWAMDADGSGLHQVTYPVSGVAYDTEATWSPDGSEIAFVRTTWNNDTEFSDIWIVKADGTGLRQLTTNNFSVDPAWSPTGDRIAFTMYSGPARHSSDLFVIHADGSGLRELGPGASMDYIGPSAPSWSPNGMRIAYVLTHRREHTGDIWTMRVDGTGMRRLTHKLGSDDISPSWSPDRTMIAFSSSRAGPYKIWTIRVDGTGLHQVTWLSTFGDFAPDWRAITR